MHPEDGPAQFHVKRLVTMNPATTFDPRIIETLRGLARVVDESELRIRELEQRLAEYTQDE